MTRIQLFEIAAKYGLPDPSLGPQEKSRRIEALKADLAAYFRTPEGRMALENAPRVLIMDEAGNPLSSDFPLQKQTVERIAELLVQEVV